MLVATLVALFLAVTFVACGGGDDSTSESAATRTQPQGGQSSKSSSNRSASKNGAPDNSQGGGSQSQAGSGAAADFTPKQHQDSGGGAAQYQVKGGDNSVQEFGQEADTSEFEAAATALHNFLDARAEGNWAATCQYLSKSTIESFEQLAAQTKSSDDSCGAILAKIANPAAKQSMKEEAAKADIGSLRTEGDQAFLIYTAGSKTILAISMAHEGGKWKVASLAGTPLN
jgi:Domain of unknown function (DUF4878)